MKVYEIRLSDKLIKIIDDDAPHFSIAPTHHFFIPKSPTHPQLGFEMSAEGVTITLSDALKLTLTHAEIVDLVRWHKEQLS
jgi:hypothetical protein